MSEIRVQAGGFGIWRRRLWTPAAASHQLVVGLRDEAPVALRIVTAAEGEPVDGATITVVTADGDRLAPPVTPGAGGAYQLGGLGAGSWLLAVEAAGFLGQRRRIEVPGPAVKVRMLRLHRLEGRVSAVPGRCRPVVELHGGPWRRRLARADRRGRFVLEAPAGVYELLARCEVPPRVSQILAGVTLGRGASPSRAPVLKLAAGHELSGRVLGPGDRPLGAARVVVFPARPSAVRFAARSAADGRFSVGPLPAGPMGCETWAAGLLPDLDRKLTLPAGPVTIRLTAGRSISGVVLAPGRDRRPAAGALVRAVLEGGAGRSPKLAGTGELGVVPGPVPRIPRPGEPVSAVAARAGLWSTTTDVSGAFTLSGLPERPLRIMAEHPRFGPAAARWDGQRAEPTRLVLTLAAGFAISGQVRTAGGAPIVGAKVSATSPAAAERLAVSDGNGRFRLEGLVGPGAAKIRVEREGYLPVALSLGLERPETRRDLVLQDAGGAQLRGQVLDEHGGPVGGARLVATGPGGLRLERRAGRDGSFVLRGVGRRRGLILRVEQPGYVTAERRLDPHADAGYVQLRLRRLGALSGRVQDGRVGAAIVVFALSLDGARRRVVRDARGAFSLAAAPGRHRLRVEAKGYASRTLDVEVGSASSAGAPVVVDLSAAGTVTGGVSDVDGRAVGGAWVSIVAPPGDPVLVRTDGRGSFALRAVAEGVRTLEVRRDRGGSVVIRQSVTVQAGRITGPLRLLLDGQ